jgi:hypothetical protein
MALTAGDRLGPYESSPPSGAGGMGEVFRDGEIVRARRAAMASVES